MIWRSKQALRPDSFRTAAEELAAGVRPSKTEMMHQRSAEESLVSWSEMKSRQRPTLALLIASDARRRWPKSGSSLVVIRVAA